MQDATLHTPSSLDDLSEDCLYEVMTYCKPSAWIHLSLTCRMLLAASSKYLLSPVFRDRVKPPQMDIAPFYSVAVSDRRIKLLHCLAQAEFEPSLKTMLHRLIKNIEDVRGTLPNPWRFKLLTIQHNLCQQPTDLALFYQYQQQHKKLRQLYYKGDARETNPLLIYFLIALFPIIFSVGLFFAPFLVEKENRAKTKAYLSPYFYKNKLTDMIEIIGEILTLWPEKFDLNLRDSLQNIAAYPSTQNRHALTQHGFKVADELALLKGQMDKRITFRIGRLTAQLLNDAMREQSSPSALIKYQHLVNHLAYQRSYRKVAADTGLVLIAPLGLAVLVYFGIYAGFAICVGQKKHIKKLAKPVYHYRFFQAVKTMPLEKAMQKFSHTYNVDSQARLPSLK